MINQIKTDFNKITEFLKLSKMNIDLRKKNLSEFINLGFPNNKEEDWKFSDLNQIISSNIKKLKFFDQELIKKDNKKPFFKDDLQQKLFLHNKIIIVNGILDFGIIC